LSEQFLSAQEAMCYNSVNRTDYIALHK